MPWNKATKPRPYVVRGGSWDDDPKLVRCAARRRSDPQWKEGYPERTSIELNSWDLVGFRIVRPLTVPPVEEMSKYWNVHVEPY